MRRWEVHMACWHLYILFSNTCGGVNFTFIFINSRCAFIDRILIVRCHITRIFIRVWNNRFVVNEASIFWNFSATLYRRLQCRGGGAWNTVSSSLGWLLAFYDESIDLSAWWGNVVAVISSETLIRLIKNSDEGGVECEILFWSHVSAPCKITSLLTIKEILMRENFRKFFRCSIKCIFNYLDICAGRSYRCYTSTAEFFKFYCYLV